MNAYSEGGALPFSRNITLSLSRKSSASFAASSEPSASPSGFSCVTSRKRWCSRSASATASSSLVRDELIDQLRHPHPPLDRRIVLEGQLGGPLQPELPCDPRLEHAVGRLEPGKRPRACSPPAKDAHEDRGVTEVGGGLDAGDRYEADPRVLQLEHGLREQLPQRLVDPSHAVTHRGAPAQAMDVGRAPRSRARRGFQT